MVTILWIWERKKIRTTSASGTFVSACYSVRDLLKYSMSHIVRVQTAVAVLRTIVNIYFT
ncbi:hypothetical protein PAHAL_1G076400 [Panicum hallii]|uniref:Uncharacterized protein n=1 Tax=Panicum hallii TaxID=206008 RepID=A0A2T8KUD5_9POAL|nr:hypothetical protein PAHAL_1G076400 [Panicum hallii]